MLHIYRAGGEQRYSRTLHLWSEIKEGGEDNGVSQCLFLLSFTSACRLLILIVWLIKFPLANSSALFIIHSIMLHNDLNVNLVRGFFFMAFRRCQHILSGAAGRQALAHSAASFEVNLILTMWYKKHHYLLPLLTPHNSLGACRCRAGTLGRANWERLGAGNKDGQLTS